MKNHSVYRVVVAPAVVSSPSPAMALDVAREIRLVLIETLETLGYQPGEVPIGIEILGPRGWRKVKDRMRRDPQPATPPVNPKEQA